MWRLVIRRSVALEDDLRFVRIPAFLFGVLGDFVHQADRKTVFVERPIVTGEVNDVHAGRFGDGFVVSAVLIVLIRDPVPVTNVSVLLRWQRRWGWSSMRGMTLICITLLSLISVSPI